MTTSIAAGSSASFGIGAWESLTLVVSGKATIVLTSLAPNLLSSSVVSQAQSKTYGPFGVPMTVVVTAVDQGVTYDVTGDLIVNNAILDGSGSPMTSPMDAWLSMPKTYTLAAVPAVNRFIDSTRGSNSNNGLTAATAWQTLAKLNTSIPEAGWCIGLANDSLFELTDRVVFTTSGSLQVNGASDASRVTFTNYDPGGVPLLRPRVRFRKVPVAGDWTWDASNLQWYYTNPNSRPWVQSAYVRIAGNWGQDRSSFAINALSAPNQYRANDDNNRIYIWSPAGTDPTTYYGGTGSIVLSEATGAILFSRCGNFVTFDNIVFEECGIGIGFNNCSAVANLAGLVVQRCSFLNVGKALYAAADIVNNFTSSAKFVGNNVQGLGHQGVHTYCKALNWEIAGNRFIDGNRSRSSGGALYAQEQPGGSAAPGANLVRENYVEDWKHNTGDHPYDGAGLYVEVLAAGWTITRNIITKCHHGVYNNSGVPVVVTHNVFDDVDVPYTVADGNAIGTTDSKFAFNTLLKCGLTKYQTSGALDNATAAIVAVSSSIGAGKTLDHRNNIIHMSAAGPAQLILSTTSYNAESNHISGLATVGLRLSTGVESTPADTSSGLVGISPTYRSQTELSAPAALSWLASPTDLYGLPTVAKRGAVGT